METSILYIRPRKFQRPAKRPEASQTRAAPQSSKKKNRRQGNNNNCGTQSSLKYNWNNLNRIVLVALGMDLDIYPGIGFSSQPKNEPETASIVKMLRSLLNLSSEIVTAVPDPYYSHLAVLE